MLLVADVSFSLDTVIIGIFAVLVGPAALVFFNAKAVSKAKEEDWARQDAVAVHAAETAALLLKQQVEESVRQKEVALRAAESSALLIKTNQGIADLTAQNLVKVKEVQDVVVVSHAILNSQYTTLLEVTMEALKGQRDLFIRLSPGDNEAIEPLTDRIDVLEKQIADRLAQQKLAEDQLKLGQDTLDLVKRNTEPRTPAFPMPVVPLPS